MELINRLLKDKINQSLFHGKAVILFGPRQVGKTTLINSILEKREEKVFVLNADEPDIRDLLNGATSTKLRTLFGNNRIVFIDEAQRVQDIGVTLKLITDQIKNVQLIVTGSASFDLSDRKKESLTGRKYEFLLFPLSFAEMVDHHGIINEKRLLEDRLIFGYYPEIVHIQEKERGF